MNKKYYAINRESLILIAMLPDNKGQLSIEFLPGYGICRDAYFVTDKVEIQDILENDSRFNKSYRLAEIDNVSIEQYLALKQIEENRKQGIKEPKVPENGLIDKTFEKINFARDFLANEPFNIDRKKIAHPTALKNKAKELGFNFIIEEDNQ